MKKTLSFNIILFAVFSSLSLSAEEEARYPLEAISRPSVMPTGIIAIDTGAKLSGLKTTSWDIGTKFGIVNKLEGQVGYDGVTFNDPEAKSTTAFTRTMNLGLKYNYGSIKHVSASVSAKTPLHIFDGEIVRSVTFGLPTVFYNDVMAGAILGDLFSLTMRPNIEVGFDFGWWYGYQIYGNLWADISSSFGSIEMKNPDNQASWKSSPFWKKLPATLTLLYAINHYFDVNANFGFDNVMKAKETMKFGVGLTIRAGSIFG